MSEKQTETDQQTATRLGISLEQYRETVAADDPNKLLHYAYHMALRFERNQTNCGGKIISPTGCVVGSANNWHDGELFAAAANILSERDQLQNRVKALEAALARAVSHMESDPRPFNCVLDECRAALATGSK